MSAPFRTIGTLARQAGLHVQTIRYYESRGLVEPAQRRPSGYREYGPEALRRLQFIRRAQLLGFTLAEIGELLALRHSPDTTADVVKARAGEKIRAVEEKLHDLTRIRNALVHLAGQCSGGHVPVDHCPLLDSLDTIGMLDRPASAAAPPAPLSTHPHLLQEPLMPDAGTLDLDCSMTVSSVISRYPSTADVFDRYGVGSCCGGAAAVDASARTAGVDPSRLCEDLRAAAAAA